MRRTPRHLFALLALLVIAVALGACSIPAPGGTGAGPTGASGAYAETLDPGQVVVDSGAASGVVLRHPADGRLAGYGFSLTVMDYGEVASAGASGANGGNGVVAPAGDVLAVVDFDFEYAGSANTGQPDLAFSAGGQLYEVGNLTAYGSDGTGELDAIAALPKGKAVSFQASLDGLTQSFSFASGARSGPAPAVLYRNPDGPDLTDSLGKTVTLPMNGGSGTESVEISAATLTFFSPAEPTVHPASAAGAYLVVQGTDQIGDAAAWFAAMPPADMSLVLPGGAVVHPDPASSAGADEATNLLDGQYFFDVPATFTRATLVLAPGVEQPAGGGTITIAGSARFALSFPPVPVTPAPARHAPPRQHPAPTTTTPRPTATTAPGRRAATAPGGGLSAGAPAQLVVLVLLLSGGGLVALRRRRRPLAVDVRARRVREPPALPAVRRPALMPGPPVRPMPPAERVESPATPPEPAPPAPAEPLAEPAPGGVVLCVLGPVRAIGFLKAPRRAVLIALLSYLAFHKDRPRSGSEVRAGLWPAGDDFDSPEAAANTLQSYASMLRRCVGEDKLPKAPASSGYRVTDAVETDWERFQAFVAAARARPAEAEELLRTALSMVRGKPFEDAGPRYEWTFAEGLLSDIEVGVVAAASDLARRELDAGRPEEAIWAARAGLKAFPDHCLCALLLDAAAAVDPGALERAWRDVGHRLGTPPQWLRTHYASLRPHDPISDDGQGPA